MMRLFSRRAALTSAASFNGIGIAPTAAAKPKGGDKPEEKPAEEVPEGSEEAAAAPSPAESKNNDDECDCEGDDDGDENDMKGGDKAGKKVRAARLRERSRVAAIMQHPSAAAHADFALKMALTTDFGRDKICQMLDAMPATIAAKTLTGRMEANSGRHAGAPPAAISGHAAIDQSWDRAVAKISRSLGA